MKINKMRILLSLPVVLMLFTGSLYGQDPMPDLAPVDVPVPATEAPREFVSATIEVSVSLPECFSEVMENQIIDDKGVLDPVLERLRLFRLGAQADTLRVLHIGDSHVRGRIFPDTAGEKLAETFGSVDYKNMGVNGATCLTFTHPLRLDGIAEYNPDLVILSFGTNESHNRKYNANIHFNQIDELVKLIRHRLPDVPMMLTTPPGSYESFRQRNRRRTYSVNPRTGIAADTIRRYGHEHQLAVWDMYSILGGAERACKNWEEAGLMRPDHIHYMPQAYALQGELLYEAIINAYNKYVIL